MYSLLLLCSHRDGSLPEVGRRHNIPGAFDSLKIHYSFLHRSRLLTRDSFKHFCGNDMWVSNTEMEEPQHQHLVLQIHPIALVLAAVRL